MVEDKLRILVNEDEVDARSALPTAGRHFIRMAVKGIEVDISEIEKDFVKIVGAVARLYESASSVTKGQAISSISFNLGFNIQGEIGLLSLLKGSADTNGSLTVTLAPRTVVSASLREKDSNENPSIRPASDAEI